MDFMERVLRKVLAYLPYKFTYMGNTAYLKLPNVKIRIDIYNTFSIDNYDAFLMTAMRNDSGVIDRKTVKFVDICGVLPTNNPNFPNGVSPHIWKGRVTEWYVACPNEAHYKMFANVIKQYIEVFE